MRYNIHGRLIYDAMDGTLTLPGSDEADSQLSITANALLKTLEEPPGDVRFVLASEAAHQLLPTIRSRCLGHTMVWPESAAMLDWLAAQAPNRLGRLAEALLAFWFTQAPHIRLAAANRLVYGQGHVIGEFDFLVWLDGEPWHLETASKFFLLVDDGQRQDWIGTSLHDAQPLKQASLQRQLALSRHPAARSSCVSRGRRCWTWARTSRCSGWRRSRRRFSFPTAKTRFALTTTRRSCT